MARAKAAEAATVTMRDRKAQAVARVLDRRRPPAYKTVGVGDNAVRWQTDAGGEFSEPADVGEWADMRQARCPVGHPVADVLFEFFEVLRGGPGAAPAAVSHIADHVRDPHQLFSLFATLNAMAEGPGGVRQAVIREWKRRKMPVTPQPMMGFEPSDWNAPSEAAKRVRYRSELGNPAGMSA